jgi:hypothetical protein
MRVERVGSGPGPIALAGTRMNGRNQRARNEGLPRRSAYQSIDVNPMMIDREDVPATSHLERPGRNVGRRPSLRTEVSD